MKLKVKVNLIDDEGKSVMGPGIVRLLELIIKEKSINKAAKKMNLSYVKALRLLNRMEGEIGKPLLIKLHGGSERGGTRLTPFGKKFLARFEKLQKNVTDYSEDIFGQFLKEVESET